jgi:hypothetical protein
VATVIGSLNRKLYKLTNELFTKLRSEVILYLFGSESVRKLLIGLLVSFCIVTVAVKILSRVVSEE